MDVSLEKMKKSKNSEVDDDVVLEEINNLSVDTKIDKTKLFIVEHKGAIVSCIIIFMIIFNNTSTIENVWKWIKLQGSSLVESGPTLKSDPIGVFSRSFIANTMGMTDIDKSNLIPISFNTITRYKNDPVLFKTEFIVSPDAKKLTSCTLEITGFLDSSNGGIEGGNYLTMMTCKGYSKQVLKGYKLLAFAPEVNALLAPPNYYLFKVDANDKEEQLEAGDDNVEK